MQEVIEYAKKYDIHTIFFEELASPKVAKTVAKAVSYTHLDVYKRQVKEPPAVITYLGKVLPCAVIGLLVVFCLKDVPESTHYGLPELIAILFIVVLHKWKKSTLLSIGGGTVFYTHLDVYKRQKFIIAMLPRQT